jgi:hypothetical protein
MSVRARSAAMMTAAIGVIFGLYFLWSSTGSRTVGESLAQLIGTIILLTVVITVFEVIVAIANRRRRGESLADERDALITARSARNGYFALLAGVWVTPVLALTGAPGLVTANFTLGMIVLAEMVNFGSRVVYDLRGA